MNKLIFILTIFCCVPFVAHALEINIGVGNSVNTGKIVNEGCEEGNGKVKKDTRTIEPFNEVLVEGAFEVELVCGDTSLWVSADSNIVGKLLTKVENGMLRIYSETSICTQNPLKIWASSPHYNRLVVSGSSEIVFDCSLPSEKLAVQLSEASEFTAKGTIGQLELEITDASEFRGYDLKSKVTSVKASGSAEAEVWASEKISGVSSDASTVNYRGNPQAVDAKALDAGDFMAGD